MCRATRASVLRRGLPIVTVAMAVATIVSPRLGAQGPPIPISPKAKLVSAPRLRLTGDVDSNSPAVWDRVGGVSQLFVLTSFAGQPSVAHGSSVSQLGPATPVTLEPWPGGGVWMEAIVPDVDGTWYGYYHNEIEADSVCPGSDKVIPRIGAARSRDRGRTWEQLGIILEAPASAFACDTNNEYFVNGTGDLSAVLDSDSRDVYFFFSQYERSTSQQGVAVARMAWADRDEPVGRLMLWRSRFWLPAAREIRTDGEAVWVYGVGVPIFATTDGWHDPGERTDAFWGPSVHWNTYLQMYVMLLSRASDTEYDQEGIYVSYSPSLDDPRLWSTPLKILDGGNWYPQVIGLEGGVGSDTVAGASARFFMAGTSQHVIQFGK